MSEHPAAQDNPVPWGRRLLALSLLPLGLVAVRVAALNPEWVEEHYSISFFPRIRGGAQALSRLVATNLMEVVLALVLAVTCMRLLGAAVDLLRGRRSLRNLFAHGFSRVLRGLGLLYFLFLVCWGFNHARQPYAVHAQLEPKPVELESLTALMDSLVQQCNELRIQLEGADLLLGDQAFGVDGRILASYGKLAAHTPILSSDPPILRQAYASPLLSLLGVSGIYSPFTGEAHLNAEIVPWLKPMVSAHEIAHFKGFAREDEANFIAWQVCSSSPDLGLRYSAAMVALMYVRGALELEAPQQAARLQGNLIDQVQQDFADNHRFWSTRRGWLMEFGQATNDAYLKSQGQQEGRMSYGRMVDLLVAASGE
ncbi:MAG: hypothetical protein ACI9F9_001288 [Candidatus Paceibacteria bacterium]|jgi:hypothetical protein